MTLREHDVTLHGVTVKLRPMTENDWEVLARWNSDPEVLWFSEGDDVQSYSLEDVQRIYRDTSQTAFCFIIEVDGQAIGECWLQKMNLDRILSRYPDQDCRRIDLTIGEKSQWGRGYGTDTIRTLTQWAFEDQGADMIFGCVADYNPRSRRAFEKAGYVEDQRIEEPAGAKAHWSYDLVLRKEDYFGDKCRTKAEFGGKQEMNRLERVRKTIDSLLCRQPDEDERRCGFVHLYGVSAICALLANRRGLDIELCATAGMLHDLSSYESGDSTNHAQRSTARAKELLAESGDFSSNEISAIAQAIFTHSSKDQVDDPMAELLKDADVLQHYLYNPSLKDGWVTDARLKALFAELGLPGN